MADSITMRLNFDPKKGSEELQEIFADYVARTFYLLWRRSHIIDQNFEFEALRFARCFRRRKPKSVSALRKCIQSGWTSDGERFATELFPFLTGEKSVGYVITETVIPQRGEK